MTTYPLEYFLSTVGTPHIKIVDWDRFESNFSDPDAGEEICKRLKQSVDVNGFASTYRFMSAQTSPGIIRIRADLLVAQQVPICELNSDDHLALTLEYGKVEDYQIGEEEAVELMREAREE